MRAEINNHLPKKRVHALVVKELPDEVLVYDLDRDKAHCLNLSAAAIWQRCDGRTTVAEIARAVGKELGSPIDSEIVWLALDSLGHDHLLEERVDRSAALPRLSRREAVRRIGIGAAFAIPIVTSIIAPTPAQASTCKARCVGCSTGSQCCSGVCASGVSGCTSGMRCT